MEQTLAVLIDFENVAAGTEKEGLGRFDIEALMTRLKDKGRIIVARSYADWGRFARFKQGLLNANISMMELTSHGMQDKNRADIAMVVDCLELAFTRTHIDAFVLVSGDSDFTPLVLKIRELNKRVIGCGTRGSTSRLLINACDEFLFYDSILQDKSRAARGRSGRGHSAAQSAAFETLVEALRGLQREDPMAQLASIAKGAVLRRAPDFSETDLGFPSFARYLEAAQDAGYVRLHRDPKSGSYRVEPVETADLEPAPSKPAPRYEPPPRRDNRDARDGREGRDNREGRDGGRDRDRGPRPERAERPADESGEAAEVSAADWRDEYMPAAAEDLVDALAQLGHHPLAAPTRNSVLEALVEACAERKKKKRRTNIQFVVEDIKKRLRRTHPDLPTSLLRGILESLLKAGLLIHRDGTPIRSASAPFMLGKDANELNKALVNFYLRLAQSNGIPVDDVPTLADLFLGNRDRTREIQEAIAWLSVSEAEGETDDLLLVEATEEGGDDFASLLQTEEEPASNDLDLDSLLSVDDGDAAPAPTQARRPEGRDDRRRDDRRGDRGDDRRGDRGGRDRRDRDRGPRRDETPAFVSTGDDQLDLDALLDIEPEPLRVSPPAARAPAPAPAAAPAPTPAPAAAPAPVAAAPVEAVVEAEAPAKPAKAPRSRSRKPAAEAAPVTAPVEAAEAELPAEAGEPAAEKPKRRSRSRKAKGDAPAADLDALLDVSDES